MSTIATRTAAAVATIAMGLAAVAGGATAAGAADVEDESTVSILMTLQLPGAQDEDDLQVFAVGDVVVGEGPELTSEDLVQGPADYCGDVSVDIDPQTGLLTISGGPDDCLVEATGVMLELSGDFVAGGSVLLQDTLFDGTATLQHLVMDGVLYATWEVDEGTAVMDGSAIFGIVAADEFPFIDVNGDAAFSTYNEHWYPISAMGGVGLANGWPTPDGPEYRPYNRTTRDALAAFLYRAFGDEEFVAPEDSPFVDVSSDPDSPFYSEHWEAIYWLAEQEVAEGWETEGGYEFRPTSQISRDAVASWMFRLDGGTSISDDDPFIDVSSDPESSDYSEHADAIAWMYDSGLSSGWLTEEGPEYRPTAKITRDAVAVFVFGAWSGDQPT